MASPGNRHCTCQLYQRTFVPYCTHTQPSKHWRPLLCIVKYRKLDKQIYSNRNRSQIWQNRINAKDTSTIRKPRQILYSTEWIHWCIADSAAGTPCTKDSSSLGTCRRLGHLAAGALACARRCSGVAATVSTRLIVGKHDVVNKTGKTPDIATPPDEHWASTIHINTQLPHNANRKPFAINPTVPFQVTFSDPCLLVTTPFVILASFPTRTGTAESREVKN